jgi:predicted pyridoxine 5'-phosphate oxidase superfamily flavin-nucleotide-binding protein
MPPIAVKFLAGRSFVVLTATDRGGRVWTTVLTGEPGFIHATTPESVDVTATLTAGDPLAPVHAEPALVGLLAIEPATRRRMRVNGRAHPTAGGWSIAVDQVVSNCPKYITKRAVHHPTGTSAGPSTVTDALSAEQVAWVSSADTFFIGTTDQAGNADASHRGGLPGFVEVSAADRFHFPDYIGNSMYLTLGNLETQPAAGFLFVDWQTGGTLQIAGRARVNYADTPSGANPTGRTIDVDVDAVVQSINPALGGWATAEYSRYNPAPETAATP